ncbi:hypothetical protein QLX08_004169 [Tetragonisca angustula]|uniref:Uncharacterized protein n=1 Tax=Tetragonisca angustula TaxID=166442 RepID=A0AAW1A3P0_9HYME
MNLAKRRNLNANLDHIFATLVSKRVEHDERNYDPGRGDEDSGHVPWTFRFLEMSTRIIDVETFWSHKPRSTT